MLTVAWQGCVTCKKRRLKCDETKPTCKECKCELKMGMFAVDTDVY